MLLIFLLSSMIGFSATDSFLERFHNDPVSAYSEIPTKTGENEPLFEMTDVLTQKYVDFKMKSHHEMCDANCQRKAKSADGYWSGVRDFFGGGEVYRNVYSLDRMKLQSGQAGIQPWSGSYWPIYKGGLAYRYADPRTRARDDWRRNERRRKFPPRTRRDKHLARLAPSEKYDFVMGDEEFNLTQQMWRHGQYYYDTNADNKVLPWMGYCHGWAVAAINEPRPRRSVKVKAADGRTVTFTPSDIKGMAAGLWGNLEFEMHYQGLLCRTRNPRRDAMGRIIDPKCNDVNPALFHTVLTNRIGLQKKSFIIDAHYDFEIWNHPVHSYSFTYFNPQTKEAVENIEDAVISKAAFSRDPFKSYRAKDGTHFLGIKLNLKYVNLRGPSTSETNSERSDSFKTATYYYDLELKEDGTILGGEWYQKAHPDVIWANREGQRPVARNEAEANLMSTWNRGSAPPAEWRRLAPYSSYKGDPLRVFVDKLIEWSQ